MNMAMLIYCCRITDIVMHLISSLGKVSSLIPPVSVMLA